jgi:hypothetical protein
MLCLAQGPGLLRLTAKPVGSAFNHEPSAALARRASPAAAAADFLDRDAAGDCRGRAVVARHAGDAVDRAAFAGFDAEKLQAHSVSGLGVQEYFMPRTSREFDLLDPAVRSCFDTPDRCRVLIFPLAAPVETGGIMSAHAAPAQPGRIVFLLRKGRVAFKEMRGV